MGEAEAVDLSLRYLLEKDPAYRYACPKRYSGSRSECDVVIAGEWAIEIKLARPFGDNGRPAERWSENLLYPYAGNTSSIGDCLKLLNSAFEERKAVLVFGYEHTPPRIPLEPAVQAFEVIAEKVVGLQLGPRVQVTVSGLIHPHHQQATVYGWEVIRQYGQSQNATVLGDAQTGR